MTYINHTITGVPFAKHKSRGDVAAAEQGTRTVIEQTQALPRVKEACIMKVTFLLPEDKFPRDYPYGPDLDNLLKRFLDALKETVLSEAPGKDSCVVSMTVMKTHATLKEDAGVHFEILPVATR
jgi:Holliday junction resolvase RusA-like endonuclease